MSPHSHGFLADSTTINISTSTASSSPISSVNALLNLTTTMATELSSYGENYKSVPESPLDRLSEQRSQTLRYVAIASSVVSITAGLVGFYMLGAIDARRRVFRHQLIFFLIGYDFLKAVTLLFYPARVALVKLAYYNDNFCDIVGFFTAMAIEGADIAIFAFAIHTALLIFTPNRKYKNGDKVEGGLFPFRFYVWIISLLVPVVFASLAFVNNVGYQPLTSWCYLPERPKWYRLVLSWVPRYVIVVTIIIIYIAIYVHVIRQFNHILYIHEEINNKKSHRLKFDKHFFNNLKYLTLKFMKGHKFTETLIQKKKNSNITTSSHPNSSSSNTTGDYESVTDIEEHFESKEVTTDNLNGNNNNNNNNNNENHADKNNDSNKLRKTLHEATMSSFEQRRIQIEKQMKSIFIYPISYIFLWLAPFALQCIQYDYELKHGPVYWLTAIAAFMQPFNCTIDTIVFLYRETPWNYTVLNVTKRIKLKHGHLYANDHSAHYYENHERWRRYMTWLPLYYIPDDNYDYYDNENNSSRWFNVVRRFRNRGTKSSMQNSNNNNDSNNNNNNNTSPATNEQTQNDMHAKIFNNPTHDFSNILGDSLNENEFRSSVPKVTIQKQQKTYNKKNNTATFGRLSEENPTDTSESRNNSSTLENPFVVLHSSSERSTPNRQVRNSHSSSATTMGAEPVTSPVAQSNPTFATAQKHPFEPHPHQQQQQRSDTVISTSDFYNMPHRASSLIRKNNSQYHGYVSNGHSNADSRKYSHGSHSSSSRRKSSSLLKSFSSSTVSSSASIGHRDSNPTNIISEQPGHEGALATMSAKQQQDGFNMSPPVFPAKYNDRQADLSGVSSKSPSGWLSWFKNGNSNNHNGNNHDNGGDDMININQPEWKDNAAAAAAAAAAEPSSFFGNYELKEVKSKPFSTLHSNAQQQSATNSTVHTASESVSKNQIEEDPISSSASPEGYHNHNHTNTMSSINTITNKTITDINNTNNTAGHGTSFTRQNSFAKALANSQQQQQHQQHQPLTRPTSLSDAHIYHNSTVSNSGQHNNNGHVSNSNPVSRSASRSASRPSSRSGSRSASRSGSTGTSRLLRKTNSLLHHTKNTPVQISKTIAGAVSQATTNEPVGAASAAALASANAHGIPVSGFGESDAGLNEGTPVGSANGNVDEDGENDDDSELDFLDFLKRGPPV